MIKSIETTSSVFMFATIPRGGISAVGRRAAGFSSWRGLNKTKWPESYRQLVGRACYRNLCNLALILFGNSRSTVQRNIVQGSKTKLFPKPLTKLGPFLVHPVGNTQPLLLKRENDLHDAQVHRSYCCCGGQYFQQGEN